MNSALIGLATCLAAQLASQTAGAQDLAHASVQDEPQEEVVVGRAKRLATYRGDALFSHVDIGRDDLSRAGAADQALKSAAQASLFRRNSSLTANPTVQGIGLRAIGPSGAGRALVTLDGIPQNDPFGGWVIWSSMPVNAIARAHVVKGAGGGAYGAGALTGVIDLGTDDSRDAYVTMAMGSRASTRLNAGGTLGALRLDYGAANLTGDVPVRGAQAGAGDVATQGRDRSLLGHAEWPLAGGVLSVLAGGYDSRRATGLSGAEARAKGSQAGISFTRQPGATPGLRLQLWSKDSDLTNRSVGISADRNSTSLANHQVKTPASGYGFNAAVRGQSPGSEWELGVDGRTSQGEAREFYRYLAGTPTRYRVAGGDSVVAGVYAEGTRRFGAVTVTGAGRLDRWRASGGYRRETDTVTGATLLDLNPADQAQTLASGRVGVGYNVGATTWRAGAYTGFRPPSLNELYRPFRVGNDVTEANESLRPETLVGAEAGFRTVRGGWSIDGDLFVAELHDPISNVTLGQGPGLFGNAGFIPTGGAYRQRANLGRIRAWGLEGQARLIINQHLTATGSGTFTHARTQGRRPAQAPQYSGSFGVDWRPGKAVVNANWLFEGDSFEDDLNLLRLKAYDRLGLDLAWPLTPHLDVTAAIDNALNNKIAISKTGSGVIGYDTRRSLWLGLRWRS